MASRRNSVILISRGHQGNHNGNCRVFTRTERRQACSIKTGRSRGPGEDMALVKLTDSIEFNLASVLAAAANTK